MAQTTNPSASVNWLEVLRDLNTRSDDSTAARQGQGAANTDLVDHLKELGLSLPDSPARPQALTPGPASRLAALRREDAAKGLRARATFNLVASRINKLRISLCSDNTIGEQTRLALMAALDSRLQAERAKLSESMAASPDAFLAIATADLRRYERQLRHGRIAQTPYVREKISEIVTHLRRGSVVFLHGQTGIGKTEVARLAAREATGGRDPLLIRGFSGMTPHELFGHMEISSSAAAPIDQQQKAIQQQMELLKRLVPDLDQKRSSELLQQIALKPGNIVTNFVLGAVYLAIKEGRTLIIDEANYIPPPLLAKLNDIMTKKVGEKVEIQEDGLPPITVQPGFGIILTGNINSDQDSTRRYQGREQFDLAFEDRIEKVAYDYLPQATQGNPADSHPNNKQLFAVVIASLFTRYKLDPRVPKEQRLLETLDNRRCSLYLPGGPLGLEALWNLCKFAAVTQAAFAGQVESNSPYAFLKDGSMVAYRPDVSLSPRVLVRLVGRWKTDGFGSSLDTLLKQALIDRSNDPFARAYLLQIGQKFNFFRDSPVTPSSPEFVPGREVISAIYGPLPERQVWPDGESHSPPAGSEDQQHAVEVLQANDSAGRVLDEVREILASFTELEDRTGEIDAIVAEAPAQNVEGAAEAKKGS